MVFLQKNESQVKKKTQSSMMALVMAFEENF